MHDQATLDTPAARGYPVISLARLSPRFLDMLADLELQHGHTGAAELLSRRAADLREAAR